MNARELGEYFESYLEVKKFTDSSKNGLQVGSGDEEIRKVGFAVDATSYLISKAVDAGVDALVVHHGLFWGYESTITGILYERVSKLVKNGIALYGLHLPLDAHPVVGNNAGIVSAFVRFFGIRGAEVLSFGQYHGQEIGFGAKFDRPVSISEFRAFSDSMGFVFDFYDFGGLSEIRSVAVVSGGGGEAVAEAKKKGYDVFITGEGVHFQHALAKELRQSVLF